MADIDCPDCGAGHEIHIDPDRPFERVECSCGGDMTDMANVAWGIVAALLSRSRAARELDGAALLTNPRATGGHER